MGVGGLTAKYGGEAGATTGANNISDSLYSQQGPGFEFNEKFGAGASMGAGGEMGFTW